MLAKAQRRLRSEHSPVQIAAYKKIEHRVRQVDFDGEK
jgi:hypothetical protein